MRITLLRSLLVPVFLFILFAMFGCGDDNPADTREDSEPGSLKGRVVDSSDPNQGLAGVAVHVEGTELTTLTDEDGNFDFGPVDCGDCAVVIDTPDDMGYQESRVEVSVHGGEAVDLDVTVLPDSFRPDRVGIYPADARIGVLESVHFHMSIDYRGTDVGGDPNGGNRPGGGDEGDGIADNAGGGLSGGKTAAGPEPGVAMSFRPTWTIRSEEPIGVISREGIFIGTAPGRGEIIATLSGEFVAVARLEVVADDDVASISIIPGGLGIVEEGEERYITALALNGAGSPMDRSAIAWSVEPAGLGTIEVADDLTQAERDEILGGERPYHPDALYGTGGDLLMDHVSIARFRAAAEVPVDGIAGEIRVAVGTFHRPVPVNLLPAGDLVSLEIFPRDSRIREGQPLLFFALAANEYNRPMRGIEFTWRLEPADLGDLESRDIPDWHGEPWGDDPTDSDDGSTVVPPHGDGGPDQPVGPPPMGDVTGQPLPEGPMVRIFHPARVGDGVLTVIARDPRTDRTVEASSNISIVERPHLSRIEIDPVRIELFTGEAMEVHARLLNSDGDVAFDAVIEWALVSDDRPVGVLDYVDKPHDADYDSVLAGGDRPTGGDPNSAGDPWPGGDRGLSRRIFRAGEEGARGTVRVSVLTEDGTGLSAEASVLVRGRP